MRYIQDHNFFHQKAIIRVDFNVPIDEVGRVTDTSRIDQAIPTIQKVLADQGAVILISHLGRPGKESSRKEALSLHQLIPHLQRALGTNIIFAKDCVGTEATQKAQDLQPGQILLLENLRFHPEEEQGNADFAKALAALGDVYINDAFATIHRQHASTYTITNYIQDKFAGALMQQELSHANKVLANIVHPFTVIIGGNKIDDKLPVIDALLDKLDTLLVGGGVANTIYHALGKPIGGTEIAPGQEETARQLLARVEALQKQIILPKDWMLYKESHGGVVVNIKFVEPGNEIAPACKIVDIGRRTIAAFQEAVLQSKTILWAGPLGICEIPYFSDGTGYVLAAVKEATKQGAFSLIGGGNTANAVREMGYAEDVSYISTGGGALLAYLANPQLPVLAALENT